MNERTLDNHEAMESEKLTETLFFFLRPFSSQKTLMNRQKHLFFKVMRFGKPIEHLEGAALATSVKDEFLRFCGVAKQLSYAGYLTFDGLIFVCLPFFYHFFAIISLFSCTHLCRQTRTRFLISNRTN